jgi:lipid-A-disaccharide synthase-like uncharacterized protein
MVWEVVGWLGTACFFTRMLLQWLLSERRGQSLVPRGFWVLSLMGALLLGSYSIRTGTWILTIGYGVTAVLYARNLWLHGAKRPRRSIPVPVATLASLTAAGVLIAASVHLPADDMPRAWLILAACGQSVWSTRFVIQWWNAERTGRSELTPLFWWWSLVGNLVLLAYTVALGNLVFMAGYTLGPFVQVRNLMLSQRGVRTREACVSAKS